MVQGKCCFISCCTCKPVIKVMSAVCIATLKSAALDAQLLMVFRQYLSMTCIALGTCNWSVGVLIRSRYKLTFYNQLL